MIFKSKKGLRRASLIAIPVVALAAGSIAIATISNAASSPTNASSYSDGRYIVTFVDDPAAAYDGYQSGFAATKPRAGEKLNPNSAAVKSWRAHLTSKHDAALAKVGASKIYDYTVTNNGVAADLTGAQAAALAKSQGIVGLELDKMSKLDTTLSPAFLGLSAAGGLWSQLGGQGNAGKGIVVGIIDSGIWPESASFANDQVGAPPAEWHGECVAGIQFKANLCGNKLVGARFYVNGFGKTNIAVADFLSPRDGSGHGSHTASTAAGNAGVSMTIDGKTIGTGSGMAPEAHVAAYKVCWEGKKDIPAGCFNSDSVAAINDAILDGVDVLNYSIGGSSESTVLDSVAQAFRGASNAGVFAANSAGNSGPGESTLDHPAPWVTTVAAATFRKAYGVVQLGNGARYLGASTTDPLPIPAPLITSIAGKLGNAAAGDANLCIDGTLDPAKVGGKIVVCTRGVNARIDKSFEVKRAGGVGMVLVNNGPNSLNGDYHAVPSVHLDDVDPDGAGPLLSPADAVAAYAATAGATAAIVGPNGPELAAAPDVPEITTFSSRGPSTTTGGDILKPDIAAPGNDVIAAVAPPTNHGRDFDFMSGTSMSSPHIAGIGALMKQLHPTWLPSEIKSALMTSAVDTKTTKSPFAQGAGFVNPNGAANPGLVYPTLPNEYRSYMISLGVQFNPPFNTLPPISASNLNQASIAIGQLAGTETVTRRVKNVGTSKEMYKPTASVPGFDIRVKPTQINLSPGEEATFTVTFTRTTAPLGAWATGSLTWTGSVHTVRSPIALQPVAVSAPGDVSVAAPFGANGSQQYQVTAGFTGTLDTSVAGLVGVTPDSASVTTGAFDINNPVADGSSTIEYLQPVPGGAKVARFSLDAVDDNADLDLFVYVETPTGLAFVDLSASGAADEQVTLVAPAEGTYHVFVNGFATPGGSTAYGLSRFVVPDSAAGNLTVTDNVSVSIASPVTLTLTWTGLDTGKRWLGVVSYGNSDDITIVSIG